MLQARRDNSLLLIESTSNQVNQYGGYVGQTPAQFASWLKTIAADMEFPFARIVIGGDHLGPHVWRKESAASAMEKAVELVRACVLAGYTKIHLDTSMRLADDPSDPDTPLADELVSQREADLCHAAEDAYRELPSGSPQPLYVIGTEVPIPGGELHDSQPPETTRPEHAARTIQLAQESFEKCALNTAWERVVALVVQPGVEFGDATVFPYNPEKTADLAQFAEQGWRGVYEAHSTDYQAPAALHEMVRDHFAILKVGPWLTFAFREAVFALASVEQEWLGERKGITISNIRGVLEQAMLANPEHWRNYYHGNEAALRFARKYSFSDRSRYYWPQPDVAAALDRLLANLTIHPSPLSLLSQYLPIQSTAVRDGIIRNHPTAMIHHKILEVTEQYAQACGMSAGKK